MDKLELTCLGLSRNRQTDVYSGLVCKAHRLLYHSTLGLRVMKKKNDMLTDACSVSGAGPALHRGPYTFNHKQQAYTLNPKP